MKKYSDLLKTAADAILGLSNQVDEANDIIKKKDEEVNSYKLALIAKERSAKSVELADKMLRLKLIKPAEYDQKVDEIMKMDDASYASLNSVVENAISNSGDAFELVEDEKGAAPITRKEASELKTIEILDASIKKK